MEKAIEVKSGSLDTMQVHNQWASRVPEERWLNLLDFHQYSTDVYHSSQTKVYSLKELKAIECSKDETGKALSIVGPSGKEAGMTNWSFQQLVGQRLGGYPSMVSRMPSKLASEVINWHIEEVGDEKIGVLLQRKAGDNVLMRAVTSEGYGRIWNYQITRPMVERFGDGVTGDWTIPGIRGKALTLETITKQTTTIFGSDKDMHIMLADEVNKISIPNRRNGKAGELSRGFIVGNSETGGGKLYLAFFTYDFLCENRIIWGLDDSFEISIKHSKNAPERWLEEIAPAIENYGKSKASAFEQRLLLAQGTRLEIGVDGIEKEVIKSLSHSFPANLITKKMVANVINAHKSEENRPIETVWDMVTAITASAKALEFTNERIPMERAGGKLLELIAN